MTAPHTNPELWERVITRLRAGSMPPAGRPRPDAATSRAVAAWLEADIDRAWTARPNPGRVNAVHRLNRTQYSNAVRDLFALDPTAFDVKSLLPGDETADGSFDNFADVLTISTAHLERYLSAARQVTRLATGLPPASPALDTFEIPLHVVQDDRQDDDLPFGSRGGIAIRYEFPVDGEYLIKVRLRRQYQDYLMGMGWPQQLDVRLDGKLLKRFTVGGTAPGTPAAASYAGDGEPGFAGAPEWETYMQLTGDAGLEVRVPVSAGPRVVGVSFVRELWEPEGLPQPQQRGRVLTNDQIYMGYAAVGSVQIGGPYRAAGTATDTPSRRAIFVCHPDAPDGAARQRTTPAPRRSCRGWRDWPTAGRSPPADVQTLLEFFDERPARRRQVRRGDPVRARADAGRSGFPAAGPAGSAAAIRGAAAAARRLSDIELASRLSFFLWSSIPDERLLDLAERGELSTPAVLAQQVRRMLADPRATSALVDDFAAQWLNLRRVERSGRASRRLSGFRRQPAGRVHAGDRALHRRARCATIAASRTCCAPTTRSSTSGWRVTTAFPGSTAPASGASRCPNPDQRGGLLAHGALLATTSYPDRTSPVLRGKWLLDNIFGVLRAAAAGRRGHDACPRSGPARCRRRFASGWRSIGPIRSAPVATR